MITQTPVAHIEPRVEWVQLIKESVNEVFEMMLGMKVGSSQNQGFRYEVTSMVGLAGSLCGLFTIRCSNETAATLASRMLGVEKVDSEIEVHDALGEICNMVAGSFKAKIPGLSDRCMLSIPTTVTGSDYKVHPMRAMPPFLEMLNQSENCPFEILLHITR